MTDLAPGDLVECVEASPKRPSDPVCLVKGSNYTVATMVEDAWGEPGVVLHEVVMPPGRPGFHVWRFRKLYRPSETFLKQCLEPVDIPATPVEVGLPWPERVR